MEDPDARVKRLYALAEKLGRVAGQARNLVDNLSAKIAKDRAAVRPSPGKSSRRSRTRTTR